MIARRAAASALVLGARRRVARGVGGGLQGGRDVRGRLDDRPRQPFRSGVRSRELGSRSARNCVPRLQARRRPASSGRVLADMLGRLGLSHFAVIPSTPDSPARSDESQRTSRLRRSPDRQADRRDRGRSRGGGRRRQAGLGGAGDWRRRHRDPVQGITETALAAGGAGRGVAARDHAAARTGELAGGDHVPRRQRRAGQEEHRCGASTPASR